MKKLNKFLTVALAAAATCLPASAITLVVDHPEAVVVQIQQPGSNTAEVINVVAGDNEVAITGTGDAMMKVTAVSPWVIDNITNMAYMSFLDAWTAAVPAGSTQTYVFTTRNPEAPETPGITLNVDHPEALDVKVSYNGGAAQVISLTAGANKIETAEAGMLSVTPVEPWTIESAEGMTVNPILGGYFVNFAAGATDSYTVVTSKPEVPRTFIILNVDHPEALDVKVSYDGGETQTIAMVEGENEIDTTVAGLMSVTAVEPWTIESAEGMVQNPFTGGYSVSFEAGATASYTIVTAKGAGEPTYLTLNVDHPTAVTVLVSYAGGEALTIPLEEGANKIETTTEGLMSVTAVEPWTIDSAEGMLQNPFTGGYSLSFEAGSTASYTITTSIELDKTAVLWVDDAAKAESFSLTASDNTVIFGGSIAAATGYNEFVFNSGWNDFTLSFTGTDLVNKVYVNGEAVEEEEGVRMLNLADNAVVKVFLAEEPVSCDVKFEVADDVKDLTVTHDVILVDNDIETISKGYSCFNGTEFKVAEGEVKLQVSVNGENITAEEGNFVFVVTQPETVVKVSENIGDSVEAITDAAAAPTAVFNLHGVKVSDTTDNLPAGLYIVAGKKVVVK